MFLLKNNYEWFERNFQILKNKDENQHLFIRRIYKFYHAAISRLLC